MTNFSEYQKAIFRNVATNSEHLIVNAYAGSRQNNYPCRIY